MERKTVREEEDVAAMLESVRTRAAEIFSNIDAATTEETDGDDGSGDGDESGDAPYHSWVRGPVDLSELAAGGGGVRPWTPTARTRRFDRLGFLLLRGFASPAEVGAMKAQMHSLAGGWEPGRKQAVFRTDEGQVTAQGSDDYFLDSADTVHFFAEKDATDEDGRLREEFREDKMAALNKAGHGMHVLPGPFRDYATSPKIRDLIRELGWSDPVIPQSMYIFKQPRVGGEITSHQDSTFLFTEPRQTCLGLWLALDDATLENGCLWVRPGSHREPVRRKFARNLAHFGGDPSAPQMVFEALADGDNRVPWDGSLPNGSDAPGRDGLFKTGFVPVECRAGDLLAFPGELDHLSLPNRSAAPRHTFQLHLVEGPGAGVSWAESNWLQYPRGKAFLGVAN